MHGTDIVDRGLIVLFFCLFLQFCGLFSRKGNGKKTAKLLFLSYFLLSRYSNVACCHALQTEIHQHPQRNQRNSLKLIVEYFGPKPRLVDVRTKSQKIDPLPRKMSALA